MSIEYVEQRNQNNGEEEKEDGEAEQTYKIQQSTSSSAALTYVNNTITWQNSNRSAIVKDEDTLQCHKLPVASSRTMHLLSYMSAIFSMHSTMSQKSYKIIIRCNYKKFSYHIENWTPDLFHHVTHKRLAFLDLVTFYAWAIQQISLATDTSKYL